MPSISSKYKIKSNIRYVYINYDYELYKCYRSIAGNAGDIPCYKIFHIPTN